MLERALNRIMLGAKTTEGKIIAVLLALSLALMAWNPIAIGMAFASDQEKESTVFLDANDKEVGEQNGGEERDSDDASGEEGLGDVNDIDNPQPNNGGEIGGSIDEGLTEGDAIGDNANEGTVDSDPANIDAAKDAEADPEDGEVAEDPEAETWKVTFYDRDAKVYDTVKVAKGEAIGTLPATIYREDYNAYWAVGEIVSGGQSSEIKVIGPRIDSTFKPEEDTIIVPDYDQISYTVSFYQADKTTPVTDESGNPVTKTVNASTSYCLNDIPTVPVKDGNTGKWVYANGDFGNTVKLEADTSVWVEYEQNVFTVTYVYEENDATKTYRTDTYYKGDTLTLPAAGPVVEGKDFVKWVDENGAEVATGATVNSDLTLTAIFDDQFAVEFVVRNDDGTASERLSQYFRSEGEPIGTMPQDPFVAGKVFEKWVIAGTETEVTSETVVESSMTVEAVFRTVDIYNITAEYYYLSDDGHEFVFNTDLLQVEEGDLPYTIEAPATTKTAEDQVDGAPDYYPETPSVTLSKEDFQGGKTKTVRFKYVPYTAIYSFVYLLKDLEGDGYTVIDREDGIRGVLNSYVTPTVKPFDYATLELAEGATITQAEGQELAVKYTRKNFAVSYETNGGSYVAGATVPYGTQYEVTSEEPTRTGYDFEGWYTDPELTQPVGATVEVKGDTTLYAKWTGKTVKYSIVYMKEAYDNATDTTSYVYENSDEATGTVGDKVDADDAPGITLNGYERDDDSTYEGSSIEIAADGSSVLIVRYKLIRYTLVFNLDNNNGRIAMNGQTYTGNNYRVTNVVLGQDISSMWPSSSNEVYSTATSGNRYFDGWTGAGSTYVTKRYELIWDNVANANNNHVMTFTAQWDNSSADRDAQYWLQQPDGNWVIADEYTQTGLNTTNLGPKNIDGYTQHNGDASRPNNTYPNSGDQDVTEWVDEYTDTYTDNGGHQSNTPGRNEQTVTRTVDGTSYTYTFDHAESYSEWIVIIVVPVQVTRYRYVYTATIPGHEKTSQKYVYNFYYDRSQYTITYMNGGTTLDTTDPIYFEADISTYGYTPSKSDCGVDSDYEFGGWFTDSGLTTPATWTTMPGNDVIVYAKWIAPEYTVTFDTDGGSEVESQSVEKYKKATNPGTPAKEGYTFEGWYSDEECNTLFDWNTQITTDTTVYAKWSRATLSYTVHYVDEENNTLAPDKTVTNPNYVVGQEITESAIAVAGYRPQFNSQTLILTGTNSENEITFVYGAKTATTNYTVRYVIADGETGEGTPVAVEKTVKGIPGDTASVVELAAAVDYATLYDAVPELDGLEFFPDAVEKTFVLAANEEQNVFTFYYSSFKSAKVTVNFVDMNGDPIPNIDSDVQILKVGKTFTLSRTPIEGWELDRAVVGSYDSGEEAGASYKITEDVAKNDLTFTLVYKKKATVTVNSLQKQYDGSALTLPAEVAGKVKVEGLLDGHTLGNVDLEYVNADSADGKGRLNAGVATVTPSNASISDAGAGYYTVRYIPGTLTVSKINVSIRIEPDRWANAPYTGTDYLVGFTNPSKTAEYGADYVMISHEGYAEEYQDDIWQMVTSLDNVTHDASAAGLGYYVLSEKDVKEGNYTYDLGLSAEDMPTSNGNYSVSLYVRPGLLEIIPAELTVTTGSASKPYDGIALKNGEASLNGLVAADEGKVTVAATGEQTVVGSSDNRYEITWGDVNPGNYNITEDLGTLEVTKGTMVLEVTDYEGVYDGAKHGVDVNIEDLPEGTKVLYSINNENWGTEPPEFVDVPDTPKTVYVKATNPNYEDATASGTVTITKQKITLTGSDKVTYNGAEQKIELVASGVVEGENLGFDRTPTVKGTNAGTYIGTMDNIDCGTWQVTKAGGAESTWNYELDVQGTLTIDPLAITIAADDLDKVYDNDPATDPELTATVETVPEGGAAPVYTLAREEGQNVGFYKITVTADAKANPNYDITVEDGTFTIGPAKITITADDKTKVYDNDPDTDPKLAATVEGAPTKGVAPVYSLSREAGQVVGKYEITVTAEMTDNPNYTIDVKPGTFEITPAKITITADDKTKVYDNDPATDPALTATVTGVPEKGVAPAYSLSREEGQDAREYAITVTAAADANKNYEVTVKPGIFTITKNKMTLTVGDYEGAYDGKPHTVTATPTVTDGTTIYYSTDGENWSTTAPTWTDVTEAQTVYVKAENPNYETATDEGTVIITKKKITLTGTKTVFYNGAEQKLELSADDAIGVAENETLGFQHTPTVKGTNAGKYTDVNYGVWYVTKANDDDSTDNYEIEVTGTLVIEKKAVTIVVNGSSDSKVYNGSAQTSETTVTPSSTDSLFDADKFSYTGATTITETDADTYTEAIDIAKASYDDANLDVTFEAGTPVTFEIEQLPVTVTILGNSIGVDYDGEEHSASGYAAVTADSDLYDVDEYVTFPEEPATATGTDAYIYYGVIDPKTFTNTNDNFDVTFYVKQNVLLTIRQVEITIAAEDKTKVYDNDPDTDPALTATVTGVPAKGVAPVYSLSREEGQDAGKYPITVTAAADANKNYKVTTTPGIFEITKDTMTLTVTGYDDTYDGASHTVTVKPSVTAGTTLYYSTDNATWSTEIPTYTDFTDGAKTIYVKAENPNYETATGSATVNITKKKITLSDEMTVPYSGEEQKLELDVADATGVVDGETLGFERTPTVKGTNAGEYTDLDHGTWYVTKAGGAESTWNYELNIKGTLTITPVAISIKAENKTKTYDNDPATDPALTATVTGVPEKGVAPVYTLSREPGQDAREYAITVTAAESSNPNYTVSTEDGIFEIEKAPLTIAAKPQVYTYNGEEQGPAGTYTEGFDTYVTVDGLKGGDALESITLTGKRVDVSIYLGAITPSAAQISGGATGDALDNYNLIYRDAQLTIERAPITITADNKVKTYDNDPTTDPALTATVTGVPEKGVAPVYTLSRELGQDVDEYAITVTAAESSNPNYNITRVPGVFKITRASTMGVVAANYTGQYDANVHEGGATATVTEGTTIKYSTDGGETWTDTVPSIKDAGTVEYMVKAENDNYETAFATGTLTVTKVPVTVTLEGQTKTVPYNGEEQEFGTFRVSIDDPSKTSTHGIYKLADPMPTAKGTDANTYPMGLSESCISASESAGNYDITFVVKDGSLTITRVPVTVTLEGLTETVPYNGEEQEFGTYQVSIDDPSKTSTHGIYKLADPMPTAKGTDANTYPMGLSESCISASESAGNYDITFVVKDGSLTIEKADLTIAAKPQTYTYNGSPQGPAGTYSAAEVAGYVTATGLKGNDALTSITIAGEQTNAGTYAGEIVPSAAAISGGATGNAFGNYNVIYENATLTINRALVTVTADDKSKVYGGEDPELTWTADGLQGSDTVGVLTVEIAREEGEDVGHYAITPSGNAVQGNYDVAYEKGDFEITKATMKVTAVNYEGVYDAKAHDGGATPSVTEGTTVQYSTDGGETWTDAAPSIKDVGTVTYKVKATNPNYEDVTVEGTLKVTPAPITLHVIGAKSTVTYNGEEQEAKGVEISFDNPTGVSFTHGEVYSYVGPISVTGTDADTYPMGIVESDVVLQEGAKNFDVTLDVQDGSLTIKKAPVTVTLAGQTETVTYNGEEQQFGEYTVSIDDPSKTSTHGIYKLADPMPKAKGTDAGTYPMGLDESCISASDSAGNYEITFVVTDGSLTIGKADLKVTAKPQTYTYNGSPQGPAGTYSSAELADYVTADGLKGGDTLDSVAIAGEQTDAGTYEEEVVPSAAEVKFNHETEKKITDNYNVTYVPATLTIEPATTMTVEAVDYNGVYDANAHEGGAKPSVTEGTTVQYSTDGGKTWTDTVPSITNVGTVNYAVKATNPNYVDAIDDGILTVTKAPITLHVTGAEATFTYDGEKKEAKGVEFSFTNPTGVPFTHGIYEYNGPNSVEGTDAGEYPMGITEDHIVLTEDAANFDVTLDVKDGMLTIEKAPVTVTLEGLTETVTYNGEEQEFGTFRVSIDDPSETSTHGIYKLADPMPMAKGTNAGTYPMGLSESSISASESAGNYEITFVVKDGSLIIEPADIDDPIDPDDPTGERRFDISTPEDVVYNGQAQQQPITITDKLTGATLGAGDFELAYSDDTTNAGTVTVTVTAEGNYTGTASRSYQITPAPLSISTPDASKEYDGTALTAAGTLTGLVNGETATFTTTGTQTEVGSSSNTYSLVWDGTAKQANYSITSESLGTLTVTEAPVIPTPTPTPTPTPAPTPDATPAPAAPAAATPTPAAGATIAIDDNANPLVEAIDDDANALADGGAQSAWSLFDLLCTILSVILTAVMLIGTIGSKRKEGEETEDGQEPDQITKRRRALKLLSIIPAVGSIVLFLLTQDLSGQMAFFDAWSVAFGVIAVVDIVFRALSIRRKTDDDNGDGEQSQTGYAPTTV